MSHEKIQKGLIGENKAAHYLTSRGYDVLAHDWKHPKFRLQIDLVARMKNRAYLVEVKHHRWTGSGFEQLLTWRQRERFVQFSRTLHLSRYLSLGWGFLWIWVKDGSCQIMETIDHS